MQRQMRYGDRWPVDSEFGSWGCWGYGTSSDISFCFCVSFSPLHFIISMHLSQVQMVWVQVSPPTNGVGVFWYSRYSKRSQLSCTDWLWEWWVCTLAYIRWLFHFLFPFPYLQLYWLWQPRMFVHNKGDNVTATWELRKGMWQCI